MLFLLHLNTYIMGLRPLEIYQLNTGTVSSTSDSDVYRRQILTYKDGLRQILTYKDGLRAEMVNDYWIPFNHTWNDVFSQYYLLHDVWRT